MVTCNFDSIKKMDRPRRSTTGSNSSGFRLLDDHCDTVSSVSRNSIYKLKIDAMFDDNKSVVSQRIDDASLTIGHSQQRGRRSKHLSSVDSIRDAAGTSSVRSNSIRRARQIHGGESFRESIATSGAGKGSVSSTRSSARLYHRGIKPINVTRTTTTTTTTTAANIIEYGVECVNNKVQKQIERMFTDVAKDESTCSFPVRCLGSLPLRSKVTSLFELQEPLRKLYLAGAGHGNQCNGNLDICGDGLRIRSTNAEPHMTPFHNIAVWSAVKFVVSQTEGGAAFLPLITDPENLDKKSLYQPLSSADKRRLSSGLHAPIFTVVMRSMHQYQQSKQLECHAFVCQTPENAIVIAATLYQSLLAHMSSSQTQKQRKPRNQNGVSCISIASSSVANRRYGSTASISSIANRGKTQSTPLPPPPAPPSSRPNRTTANHNKRVAENSLSSDTDNIVRNALLETSSSSDQRKKRSYKTRRAPPIPQDSLKQGSSLYNISSSYRVHQMNTQNRHNLQHYQTSDQVGGDILTRVAIPRSGSFLNTSGLARYKSRATRRAVGKCGGGGGSPLGFSELFNEFRLQENLHSLDDILNAIIDSEGMSFNDLKPIYKEFLLKLAVTLTKDELYQRSKSIMRRQKKKLMRRKKNSAATYQNKKQTSAASLDGLAMRVNKQNRSKALTSGSDLSETHNELTLNGQNRNSSSGYVSYSECSYNSDACTCASADRCYCSLGADHNGISRRLKPNHSTTLIHNHDTLISCRTEDKCYCSLDEDGGDQSTATYCDTDSCISTTKCYCKHRVIRPTATAITKKVNRTCITDSLALDYELFTIANGGRCNSSIRARNSTKHKSNAKHVRSQEALSVKKSVEMAAVFADVKLSQTTDIKNISAGLTTSSEEEQKAIVLKNNRQNSAASQRDHCSKKCSSMRTKSTKSNNAIMPKCIESAELNPLFRKKTQKINKMYQTITPKVVGATLEDSLGYLP